MRFCDLNHVLGEPQELGVQNLPERQEEAQRKTVKQKRCSPARENKETGLLGLLGLLEGIFRELQYSVATVLSWFQRAPVYLPTMLCPSKIGGDKGK